MNSFERLRSAVQSLWQTKVAAYETKERDLSHGLAYLRGRAAMTEAVLQTYIEDSHVERLEKEFVEAIGIPMIWKGVKLGEGYLNIEERTKGIRRKKIELPKGRYLYGIDLNSYGINSWSDLEPPEEVVYTVGFNGRFGRQISYYQKEWTHDEITMRVQLSGDIIVEGKKRQVISQTDWRKSSTILATAMEKAYHDPRQVTGLKRINDAGGGSKS